MHVGVKLCLAVICQLHTKRDVCCSGFSGLSACVSACLSAGFVGDMIVNIQVVQVSLIKVTSPGFARVLLVPRETQLVLRDGSLLVIGPELLTDYHPLAPAWVSPRYRQHVERAAGVQSMHPKPTE